MGTVNEHFLSCGSGGFHMFLSSSNEMGSNGIHSSPKVLDLEGSSSRSNCVDASEELDKKLVGEVSDANVVRPAEEDEMAGTFVVGSKAVIEQLENWRVNSDVSSTNGLDYQRSNSLQQSLVLDITPSKEGSVSSSHRAPKG